MSGTTTELSLSTAVDTDDNADYLTLSLANSLRTVDALFNNVTGHNHGGAHQGATVAPGAIPGGSITNAMLGADVARDNQLVDGGFDVWQRGSGPFTANGAFSADRWFVGLSGTDTLSVSRDTANRDTGSSACAACVFVLGTGGGTTNLNQTLRISTDGYQFAGKTLSLSVRVRTSTANAARLRLASDGTGAVQVFSSFHSGGGAYETLTAPACAIPSDATFIVATVVFAASCTAYLDNAMLVVGSQAANYVPMHPADDLARCLRYYERFDATNGQPLGLTQCYAATATIGWLSFKVQKPLIPTMTVSAASGFQVLNAAGAPIVTTAVTAPLSSAQGVQINATVGSGLVAGNAALFAAASAQAAVIYAEANP